MRHPLGTLVLFGFAVVSGLVVGHVLRALEVPWWVNVLMLPMFFSFGIGIWIVGMFVLDWWEGEPSRIGLAPYVPGQPDGSHERID